MATATLTIEDKPDGPGVLYKIELAPTPKTKDEITMAQNLGLTMFDAIESTLKKFGATITPPPGGTNAQTPGRG